MMFFFNDSNISRHLLIKMVPNTALITFSSFFPNLSFLTYISDSTSTRLFREQHFFNYLSLISPKSVLGPEPLWLKGAIQNQRFTEVNVNTLEFSMSLKLNLDPFKVSGQTEAEHIRSAWAPHTVWICIAWSEKWNAVIVCSGPVIHLFLFSVLYHESHVSILRNRPIFKKSGSS